MSTTETFWGEEQPTDSVTACAAARVVLFRESCDEGGRVVWWWVFFLRRRDGIKVVGGAAGTAFGQNFSFSGAM